VSPARFVVGDALEVMGTMPEGSVDLVLTSFPFLALRSYLPADHPDKHREIGSEATPEAYIDVLLDLTEEFARVLAPHGSICVELGDTYSGSGGAGGDYGNGGLRDGQAKFDGSALADRKNKVLREDGNRLQQGPSWPLAKSLCLIPESYRWALVYGRNPFNGRTTEPWRARNVVRWCRPNPPVGALGDKLRPATSDMVIACKSGKRYFDLDAIRTEHSRENYGNTTSNRSKRLTNSRRDDGEQYYTDRNPAGAPPLDHWWHDDTFPQDAWHIPTQPYKGSHYATWPEALCVLPIQAMCPQKVCVTCGKPSERITEIDKTSVAGRFVSASTEARHTERIKDVISPGGGVQAPTEREGFRTHGSASITLGWTDCGHDNWRTGVVLDPFAGSGTTLAVAVGNGRDAIGIDLDERNAELVRERCGMFIEVVG
jgi:DNA modification methylase